MLAAFDRRPVLAVIPVPALLCIDTAVRVNVAALRQTLVFAFAAGGMFRVGLRGFGARLRPIGVGSLLFVMRMRPCDKRLRLFDMRMRPFVMRLRPFVMRMRPFDKRLCLCDKRLPPFDKRLPPFDVGLLPFDLRERILAVRLPMLGVRAQWFDLEPVRIFV